MKTDTLWHLPCHGWGVIHAGALAEPVPISAEPDPAWRRRLAATLSSGRGRREQLLLVRLEGIVRLVPMADLAAEQPDNQQPQEATRMADARYKIGRVIGPCKSHKGQIGSVLNNDPIDVDHPGQIVRLRFVDGAEGTYPATWVRLFGRSDP
jgi:hypothetical protein